MTRAVVVTGTDTGIGKTVAGAALAVVSGPQVLYVKPAQTGVGPDTADRDTVAALAGCDTVELARYDEPLAPDVAARRQGVETVSVADHAARIVDLADGRDTVLIEGAGGVLVRLDAAGGTLLDLVAALPDDWTVEIVVVTRSALGTLNHTELTTDAIRARGFEPAGLVIGSWPDVPAIADEVGRDELPKVTGVPLIATIPAGSGALDGQEFRRQATAWFQASYL